MFPTTNVIMTRGGGWVRGRDAKKIHQKHRFSGQLQCQFFEQVNPIFLTLLITLATHSFVVSFSSFLHKKSFVNLAETSQSMFRFSKKLIFGSCKKTIAIQCRNRKNFNFIDFWGWRSWTQRQDDVSRRKNGYVSEPLASYRAKSFKFEIYEVFTRH